MMQTGSMLLRKANFKCLANSMSLKTSWHANARAFACRQVSNSASVNASTEQATKRPVSVTSLYRSNISVQSLASVSTNSCAPAAQANVQQLSQSRETEPSSILQFAIPSGAYSVKLLWDDDYSADFHYVWLRDCCPCADCHHPVTHQKLLDTPSIPMDISPQKLHVDVKTGNLEITWSNDGHRSVFSGEWLREHVYSTSLSRQQRANEAKSRTVLWNQTTIEESMPVMEYAELKESDEGVYKWLSMLERYGVALVRGSPISANQVTDMARKIAHVKETSYGILFDVVNEPKPGAHLAFTGVELKHHTDMNYMEKSPGIQLLHCMRADAVGGESVFVDGFWIAEWMRKADPAAFHVLSTVDVGFAIKNWQYSYMNHSPIICLDRKREVSEVHVNNRTMQPIHSHPDVIMPFYSAFKLMNDKMRERSSELRLDMRPGDVVAFNNRRVLHGRTAFDPQSGHRHLQGCYVDMDEFRSRLRSLREKLGDKN